MRLLTHCRALLPGLLAFRLATSAEATAQARTTDWQVGDQAEAGSGSYCSATGPEASSGKNYYCLPYAAPTAKDSAKEWVASGNSRPHNTAQVLKNLAAGPRLGKYLLYAYGASAVGMYLGYFELRPGGEYHVFAPGGRDIGNGKYAFDKARTRVQWQSGPFANPDWDGTQQFEVSRAGKTHIIRLKRNTIGTNSTDSAQ